MMNKKRCMNCMMLIDGDIGVCPRCGFQEKYYRPEFYHLPIGHSLQNGRYQIGIVIGEGGFGLTYIGWDGKFGQVVAIKEFYAKEMLSRDNTVSHNVRLYRQSDEESYRQSLKRVEREARTLKHFSDCPGIVRVEDFFEENNTIYIVMEYVNGQTLKQYQQQAGSRIDEAKWLSLFRNLLRSLHSLHKEGVIHRDISLTNIMVRQDESLVLIDFGSARQLDQETVGFTIKEGYAPLEQYVPNGNNQGAWLDVYAISVCLYNCLTGRPLLDAKDRSLQDIDIWTGMDAEAKIRKNVKNALRKGLELDYQKRYQSVSELYKGLYGEEIIPPEPVSTANNNAMTERTNKGKDGQSKNKKLILAASGAATTVIVAAVVMMAGSAVLNKEKQSASEALNSDLIVETSTLESETLEGKTPEEWTDQEGNQYKGVRMDGLLEGEGTCVYANGETYTGQWAKGKPNGEGTWVYTNGTRYEGEFKDGEKEGKGTQYYANGNRYEGEWVNGNMEGQGICYYTNGNRYEGEWINDKKEGKGIEYYINGDRYEGEWVNDIREGKGIYYSANGVRYEGEWVNDIREGQGIEYYTNGGCYDGEWVNNKQEGKGIYYWADGSRYEGQWVNGIREGKGIHYYSEDGDYAGCRQEQTWKGDKLDGEVILYKNDGTTVTEQWKDGNRIN